ncbi:hypothetical protein GETHPA_17430 [Geothrix rubra]|uniref:Uncharacterized protein n=1 Tax=Geothrix rubra TaxID=2927977 RepID=A0ABQ5Q619_9BACT|nr:hypothetical protein [Geothrix rubra]GLH70210.1 hypothetical protein GETHPA_17430 [Geothrix rubra]
MAVVIVQSPSLSADQKRRVGERIITALQNEDIAPGSVVVLFRPERGDIYLDGLLVEAQARPQAALPPAPAPAPRPAAVEPQAEVPAFKSKARRNKGELEDLKQNLVLELQKAGSLSSFEAQEALGLKDCDWAPATLRRLFTELEEAKLIGKTGQKRGTRYQWKGIASTQAPAPAVKLVKADPEE